MLKVWNLALVIISFALSIFGTFEVRSGLISSVHSFAYSDIGSYYFVFLVIVLLFSAGLFVFRLPKLKAEQEFDSLVSREGVFLFNNLLLVGIAFATLWGTLFPLISAALQHQTMTVGPPFYDQVISPIFTVLILAMGVGPLLAWRRTSSNALWRNLSVPVVITAVCALLLPLLGITNLLPNIGLDFCAFTASAILYELWRGMRVRHSHGESYIVALYKLFQRQRQRYGGYVVHMGLVLLTVGVIGSNFFQIQHDAVLKPGQETAVAGYRFVYFGNIDAKDPAQETITAQLQLWQNGHLIHYIYPGRTIYKNFDNQPATLISITTVGLNDLYVVLTDYSGPGQATIRVYVNPLVPLVWWGGIIMLLGGLICWWPAQKSVAGRRVKRPARQSSTEVPEQVSDKGAVV